MKTMTCDLCEHSESAETFEAWMKALMPHYMQAHAEVMKDESKTEEDKMQWMKENAERFETTPVDA